MILIAYHNNYNDYGYIHDKHDYRIKRAHNREYSYVPFIKILILFLKPFLFVLLCYRSLYKPHSMKHSLHTGVYRVHAFLNIHKHRGGFVDINRDN